MKNSNGYYLVDNKIFYNKFFAIIEASKNQKNIEWLYHTDIYEKASLSFRNYDTSLQEIYKKRALQLRDSYDYLILNYSGGSDSHNILLTFLKNNIKLDHIYVQWPISLTDKGIYTPNSVDKSNFNFSSEWDLVIKKDLEWISVNHPDIKIEIDDWSLTVKENFYSDDLYQNDITNLPSIARAQKQNTFSKEESRLSNKGLKVGSIYGVDKPFILIKDDIPYFRFADGTLMTRPNPENPDGLEYFYFTPNMPEIPILQTYKLYQYYKLNKKEFHLVCDLNYKKNFYPEEYKKIFNYNSWRKTFDQYNENFKLVCYPYWDFNRFQAEKGSSIIEGLKMGVRGHDKILVKGLSHFSKVQQKWEYLWLSYKDKINDTFLINQDTVKSIKTKWFKLNINS